jgi:hypothetical protein
MATSCHGCGATLDIDGTIGRRSACPHCDADLHSCINCRFYEETAPHECREPHADHYVDKIASNACDLYKLGDGASRRRGSSQAARDRLGALFGEAPKPAPDPRDALEALFRKK